MTSQSDKNGNRSHSHRPLRAGWGAALLSLCAGALLAGLLFAGCTSAQHRQKADKEAYGIIQGKQKKLFGRTNEFHVETRYSARDPKDIPSVEIIQERITSGKRRITLPDALQIAVTNSRTYQINKENLYLEALKLTKTRNTFSPILSGSSDGTVERQGDGEQTRRLTSTLGFSQLLKSGANITATLVNDVLRYYTGSGSSTALSTMSVTLTQPLLRGAGAAVVAEALTQADRNVIYKVREFTHFQNSYAVEIVGKYYGILQQKDAVKNAFTNYSNLVLSRQRAEALSFDRLPAFQADQARQDELRAKSTYILAVERYQSLVDAFKRDYLGLPLGVEITLDDGALSELQAAGLQPLALGENEGYEIAVEGRLDLLNEIDRFEDFKRKIKVAASKLKAGLDFSANASLPSQGTDYTRFNAGDYQASAGLELKLPLNRVTERADYRESFIDFEQQLRKLSLALDNVHNDVRLGLRTLQQVRQSYSIQLVAAQLADRRVESATLLLQAGRAQIRDLLEAQNAQLTARNAVTAALVDYQNARLGLLLDLGRLDTGTERFWVRQIAVSRQPAAPPGPKPGDGDLIPPDKLFAQ